MVKVCAPSSLHYEFISLLIRVSNLFLRFHTISNGLVLILLQLFRDLHVIIGDVLVIEVFILVLLLPSGSLLILL